MALPPSFLEQIRDRLSVSQVIGRRVALTKKGREHHGLCPFHNEKTPSFTVNDEKGFGHCFGCGWHGDAIEFEMQAGHLSFIEAVERLAAEVGLEVPAVSPEERQHQAARASLLGAAEAACAYFEAQLQTPAGETALAYLRGRGLSDETIARFRLGWAPDSRSALIAALKSAGYDASVQLQAGLAKAPEGGGAPYAYFRGRVTFPITDRQGRVIAFGARILGDGQPKYLNSPATALFDKGQTLFGAAHARVAAGQKGVVHAVEGYLDAIVLHQAGLDNTVAPLGTAITEHQIQQLWRMADEPVICLDGDDAGQKAAERAALKALPILEPGKSLLFAVLPTGEDPDSLVRRAGAEAFEGLTVAARPLVDVLWASITEGRNTDTPERRAAIERDTTERVQAIRNAAVRDQYMREMRRRLEQADIVEAAAPSIEPAPEPVRHQPTDAASLLSPPEEFRDEELPHRYLAHRLKVPVEDLVPLSTPVAGWNSLAYFDPPAAGGSGPPVLVGSYACAVFGTVGTAGGQHAHRIYVAAGGQGLAELPDAADGRRRNTDKPAKRSGNDTRGFGAVWGRLDQVLQVLLCERIEVGAALAQAFAAEIAADKISVVAALSPDGIASFAPLTNHAWVTVCADRDEAKEGARYKAGEKAARAFGRKHQDKAKVQLALPGAGGESSNWLQVFLQQGAQAVRQAVLAAKAFDAEEDPEFPDRFPNPYKVLNNGFVFEKVDPKTHELSLVPLTDYTARIVSDILRDDGAEKTRHFEIEAVLASGQRRRVTVPADRFNRMDWITVELGHAARTSAGSTVRDHVRAAIQFHSEGAAEEVIYAHTGWRQVNGHWAYLHAGGGIGADGAVASVRTDLQLLAEGGYELPTVDPQQPPDARAMMELFEGAARSHVSIPVFAAVWLAPLVHLLPPSCLLALAGFTGTGKTAVTALAQQSFGPRMDAKHIPASWFDTANSLIGKTFLAKDALLLIDDFVPRGSREEVARANANFARVAQMIGNNTGRSRMGPDANLRPERRPRSLVITTGEDLITAQSAVARMIVVDVSPGDVRFGGGLDAAQAAASDGRFAAVVASYVQWLAKRLDAVGEKALERALANQFKRLRVSMSNSIKKVSHMRTPENLAYLATGLSMFLDYAKETGAVSQELADAKWADWWTVLAKIGMAQGDSVTSADPIRRFFQLLRSALSSGQAHFAGKDGQTPAGDRGFDAISLGWMGGLRHGDCAGWISASDGDVFLDADAALRAVNRMSSEPFAWTKTTFAKRLSERKMLAGTDIHRGTLYVNRKLAGSSRAVLWIKVDTLLGGEAEEETAVIDPPRLVCDGDQVAEGTDSSLLVPAQSSDGEGQGMTVNFRRLVEVDGGSLDDWDERVSILMVEGGLEQRAAEIAAAREFGLVS